MPEGKRASRYRDVFTLGDAAKAGMLVVVKCTACRRCIHFLATDLVEVLSPAKPAIDPPCRCSRCKTAEYMRVDVRQPHPGDIGKLMVRRPGKPRVVRDWRDMPL